MSWQSIMQDYMKKGYELTVSSNGSIVAVKPKATVKGKKAAGNDGAVPVLSAGSYCGMFCDSPCHAIDMAKFIIDKLESELR